MIDASAYKSLSSRHEARAADVATADFGDDDVEALMQVASDAYFSKFNNLTHALNGRGSSA